MDGWMCVCVCMHACVHAWVRAQHSLDLELVEVVLGDASLQELLVEIETEVEHREAIGRLGDDIEDLCVHVCMCACVHVCVNDAYTHTHRKSSAYIYTYTDLLHTCKSCM